MAQTNLPTRLQVGEKTVNIQQRLGNVQSVRYERYPLFEWFSHS